MRVRGQPAVIALCALAAGCGEQPTVLYVTVTAKKAVPPPTALVVDFIHEGEDLTATLEPGGGQEISLPNTFALKANGRQGTARLVVKAQRARRTVGEGRAKTDIVPQSRVDLTVELHPWDFQLNAIYRGEQGFCSVALRQAARLVQRRLRRGVAGPQPVR